MGIQPDTFCSFGDYPAGCHEVQIGKDELGAKGVYYYRLQTPGFTESRKMVLMDWMVSISDF